MLKSKGLLLFTSMLVSISAIANTENIHTIIAKDCLIADLTHYQKLATRDSLVLIQVNDQGVDELITAKQIILNLFVGTVKGEIM